jgi:hypothetical protein
MELVYRSIARVSFRFHLFLLYHREIQPVGPHALRAIYDEKVTFISKVSEES